MNRLRSFLSTIRYADRTTVAACVLAGATVAAAAAIAFAW